jgi:hypothetical protein
MRGEIDTLDVGESIKKVELSIKVFAFKLNHPFPLPLYYIAISIKAKHVKCKKLNL